MAFDGLVISNIVYELNQTILNARISKIAQPENDELLSWKDSKGFQDLDVEIGDTVVLKSFRVKNQYVSKAYGNVSSVTYLKME